MGAKKKILFPYWEELYDDYWFKNSQEPTDKESADMWKRAEEVYCQLVEAQRKSERESP